MDYDKQIADIMEDLIQGHNWDYADKEFSKLVKKVFEDGVQRGRIIEFDEMLWAKKHPKGLKA